MRFQTIFQSRKNMMAIAILLVLLYHNKGALPESFLKQLAAYAYGGVDIFFFASGIGCFFSWCRDRDPSAFLRRRAERLLPAWLPFILVWLALQAMQGELGLSAALANFLGVQGFRQIQPRFNWYVSFLWLSYLLTPFLAPLAEHADTRLRRALPVALLLLLSAAFWGDEEWIIMVSRLPVFFTGMLFAAESRRRDSLSRGELLALALLSLVGAGLLLLFSRRLPELCWSHGLAWYPFLLIIPGLCVLIASLAEGLEHVAAGRALNRALGFLGGFTFEIYLVHFWALERSSLLFLPMTALMTAALYGAECLIRRFMKRA